MRTTLNLDDDVVAHLHDEAASDGRSLSRVANDLLRAGLRATRQRPEEVRYDPPVLDTGRPLLDITDIGAVLDLLDERA